MDQLYQAVQNYMAGKLTLPGKEVKRILSNRPVEAFVTQPFEVTLEGLLIARHQILMEEEDLDIINKEGGVLVGEKKVLNYKNTNFTVLK